MTVGSAIRSAVSIGWLLQAFLLERIVTLGAITDVSDVSQNPPLFVAVSALLIGLSVSTAVAVVANVRSWPILSLAASVAYLAAGVWLRLENGDDSGAAIAVIALVIVVWSLAALGQGLHVAPPSTRPPGE